MSSGAVEQRYGTCPSRTVRETRYHRRGIILAANEVFLSYSSADRERVGVSIAVADAHAGALELARYVTQKRGGDGAVREVADLILAARAAGTRAC